MSSAFNALGLFACRHRWAVVFVWALLLLVAGLVVARAGWHLQFGGFTSERMESVRARQVLESELGPQPSSLVVLFTNQTLRAGEPEFERQVAYAIEEVRDAPGVGQVVDHLTNPRQISRDRHTVYELVLLQADEEEAARDVPDLTSRLRSPATMPGRDPGLPALEVHVTGGPLFFSEVERLSHEDLQRAEMVAFPFAAIALLVVFGSLVAAGLPVALGGATVVGILAGIAILSRVADLSVFVLNVATMLGLGLGVDYSLFLVSRFREEIAARHGSPDPVATAVASTMSSAGVAVFFSGLSVLLGLAGLASFEFLLLRSLGVVGMLGIAICLAAALTLLPAILSIVGAGVNRWPVFGGRMTLGGFWERSAAWVMRHPVAVFVPTMLLLISLGLPFLHVRFSAPDANILPPDLPSRRALDLLRSRFGESETSPVLVVVRTEGSVFDPDNLSRLYDLTHSLARDPRVAGVESLVDLDPRMTKAQYQLIYRDPASISDAYAKQVARITTGRTATLVKVFTRGTPVSEESKQLVRDLRAAQPGGGMSLLVDGTAAEVIDVVDTLYADAPRALAFVVTAIYAILLILFRSVLLPLKALVMNTLSILASYGALVYIFQDGHFEQLLGFRSSGTIEASMPVILFCILFGLSMDYEVFLLTRIKEEYARTGDNTTAVAKGLEKSGKIITSAAIIVVVVGVAFVAADIVIIKALGIGIALAVFLDATVVRTLLVPATMRLLGHWNWWAPRWLLRMLPEAGENR